MSFLDSMFSIFGRNGSAHEGASSSPARRSPNGPKPTDAKNELPTQTRSELMRRARWLDKNSGMSRALSRDMQLYSIGDGIRPQGVTSDTEWNKAAERYFQDWARNADITRRYSLTQLLHITSRTLDRDGEVFAVKSRTKFGKPAIQLIEAHRCGDGDKPLPGMIDGIQYDEFGGPIAYRFIRDDGTARDVPAGAVCHIHDPESISATRSRSPISHGINSLIDGQEILALNKKGVKDQLAVARAVFTPEGTSESAGAAFGDEIAADGTVTAEEVNRAIGGSTAILPTGSQVTNLTNNLPNPTFQGFMEHLDREPTLGNLPYEFVRDPSKVGGAGVRLVVGKADRVFSHRQMLIIEQLLDKVWAWVIADAIANDLLPANADFWRVAWVTPRRVTVDAGRDANANREDIKVGLKTMSDDYAERGMDYEEELRRMARDAKLRKDIAAEFEIPESALYNPAPNVAPSVTVNTDPNA